MKELSVEKIRDALASGKDGVVFDHDNGMFYHAADVVDFLLLHIADLERQAKEIEKLRKRASSMRRGLELISLMVDADECKRAPGVAREALKDSEPVKGGE